MNLNFSTRLPEKIVGILQDGGVGELGAVTTRYIPQVLIVCSSLVLLDGIFDFLTGPYVSFSILYLLPVGLATWLISRRVGFIFAVASALICLFCDLSVGGFQSRPGIPYFNCLMRFGVFVIVVCLLSALRQQTWRLNKAVADRTTQLQKEIAERRRVEREVFQVLQQQKQAMAHELHDGLAQALTALAMNTKHLEEELQAAFSPQAEAALQIVKRLNAAVGRTRQIAYGLSPTTIGANELISALRQFALETESTFAIKCAVKTDLPRLAVATDVGLHLYRIVQQATDNAIRHGNATKIEITIENGSSAYRLAIRDNGAGFAIATTPPSGLGLKTMQFRADLLGACIHISSVPGKGTCVEIIGELAGLTPLRLERTPGAEATLAPFDV